MPPVARLGDTGDHGGEIATGSPTGSADGSPIARIGDTYACPIHGPNPIVTGSSIYSLDGAQVARIGDSTACGAVITSGSPTHSSN
jgi:uncharacterized Zn-binding protein involved in type VI secretion